MLQLKFNQHRVSTSTAELNKKDKIWKLNFKIKKLQQENHELSHFKKVYKREDT